MNPRNPSQLLVGAEDFNCSSIQGFFASSNGGTSWDHRCLTSLDGVGEPIVGYDLNGVAYGGGITDWTQIVIRSSTDNGDHWGKAKVADLNGLGTSWPWLAVDVDPVSPFMNMLYISAVHGGVYSDHTRMHVSHSSDGGQHWIGTYLDRWQDPHIDLFSHVTTGPDGTAYATWMRCHRDNMGICDKTAVPILFSKSGDGGNMWTEPVTVAKVNLVSPDGCLYGCIPHTSVPASNVPVSAVFGSGSTADVYVVFYSWTGTQMQVELVSSSDGGKTFGVPSVVSNSKAGDQFFPWISLADDGRIAVTWLDRRNDAANLRYQPYLAISEGGITFTSHALSQILSDPDVSFPVTVYRSNLWVGSTLYATWMDTRSGIGRVELGGVQF